MQIFIKTHIQNAVIILEAKSSIVVDNVKAKILDREG